MSPKDALDKLLEMRRLAILDLLLSPLPNSQSLASHLCEVLTSLRQTLEDILHLFVFSEPGEPSVAPLLTRVIDSTLAGRAQGNNDAAISSAIIGLFSEKTNLHVICRYLPSSIKDYHFPSKSLNSRTSTHDVRRTVEQWLQTISKDIQKGLEKLFGQVTSGKALAQIRHHIVEYVAKVEGHRDLQLSAKGDGDNNSSWDQVCTIVNIENILANCLIRPYLQLCADLLGHPYSLWTDLIRPTFNSSAERVICQSFESLATQPDVILRPRLKSLGDVSAPGMFLNLLSGNLRARLIDDIDRHIAEYMWSRESYVPGVPEMNTTLAYRLESPALANFCDAFEDLLHEIKSDLDALFVDLPGTPAVDTSHGDR